MTTTLQDPRFAQHCPGPGLTAVLALALACAANVILCAVLLALILRPGDLSHPDRRTTLAQAEQDHPTSSSLRVRNVRNENSGLSAVAAWGMQKFGLEADAVISFRVTIQSPKGRP
jgi:hypothetical protein